MATIISLIGYQLENTGFLAAVFALMMKLFQSFEAKNGLSGAKDCQFYTELMCLKLI